ncbi:helix-turn-helix transcriptional regulator [Paenibacillus sp. 2TAF8]|uniref:helix-turn-helix transcriptional regulator n=1 Tax=Paenibacillus sp. 2TAF8 TaxID=3233020 RepID=UPI003F9C8D52
MILNNVQKLRKESGLTQEELAKILLVTRQTIVAIENNKFNPSLELSFRIADYFKKSIEEIFFRGDDEL